MPEKMSHSTRINDIYNEGVSITRRWEMANDRLAPQHPNNTNARAADGGEDSAQAFAQRYRAHVGPLYRYLYSRVGSAAEAEELTSQTFLAALEGLPRYREGNFSAWLFGIARRKAADYFRRRPEQPLEEEALLAGEPGPLEALLQDERSHRLVSLVSQLNEEERELLRLRYTADLSYPQIGQVLGRSPEAVKKQVHRLLRRLKAQMEAGDG